MIVAGGMGLSSKMSLAVLGRTRELRATRTTVARALAYE
jgi:hypothetical protein